MELEAGRGDAHCGQDEHDYLGSEEDLSIHPEVSVFCANSIGVAFALKLPSKDRPVVEFSSCNTRSHSVCYGSHYRHNRLAGGYGHMTASKRIAPG